MNSVNADPDTMTIQEVADYLKINVMTAYRKAGAGYFPFMFQVGSQWRARFDWLDAWVDKRIQEHMAS